MQIFISYAREDKAVAHHIFQYLSDIEEIRPWMDLQRIQPGILWETATLQAIAESQLFVFLVTHTSVHKDGFIRRELSSALHLQNQKLPGDIFVVPVRLDATPLPEGIQQFHAIDLHSNRDRGLAELRSVIQHRLTDNLGRAFAKLAQPLTSEFIGQWRQDYFAFVGSHSPTTVCRFLNTHFKRWPDELNALQLVVESHENADQTASYVMRIHDVAANTVNYIDTVWRASGLFLHYVKRLPVHLGNMVIRNAFESYHRMCRSGAGNTFTVSLLLLDTAKHYISFPCTRDESDIFIAQRALEALAKYDLLFCEMVIFFAKRVNSNDVLLEILPIISKHYYDISLLEWAPTARTDDLTTILRITKSSWKRMEYISNYDEGERRAKLHGMLLRIANGLCEQENPRTINFARDLRDFALDSLKNIFSVEIIKAIRSLSDVNRAVMWEYIERANIHGVSEIMSIDVNQAKSLVDHIVDPFCAYVVPGDNTIHYPIIDESAFKQHVYDGVWFGR